MPPVKRPIKNAKKSNSFLEIPPSAMMMPPKMNSGTARIGVESAPEKALVMSWV